ncbi:hypothetical protein [Clostridium sp. UBA4548]|uniref:hypothetical protein n=1 Tax=Clostridium sp. UBA4548 TaxID=1946361 RepID=UPI0025C6765E|nr:hypothetical protein [Clostridium sp. UBA4548]
MEKQPISRKEVNRKQRATEMIMEILSRKMISIDGTESDSYVYSFKNIEERLSKLDRYVEVLQLKYLGQRELLDELNFIKGGINRTKHEYNKINGLISDIIFDEDYLIGNNELFSKSEKLLLISKVFNI